MTSAIRDDNGEEGAEFIYEDDGSIIVRDIGTGIAPFGETKSEVLRVLSEVSPLHEEGGESVTDEDFEELGLDTDEFDDRESPDFMQ